MHAEHAVESASSMAVGRGVGAAVSGSSLAPQTLRSERRRETADLVLVGGAIVLGLVAYCRRSRRLEALAWLVGATVVSGGWPRCRAITRRDVRWRSCCDGESGERGARRGVRAGRQSETTSEKTSKE